MQETKETEALKKHRPQAGCKGRFKGWFVFIGDENEGLHSRHYNGAMEMKETLGLNDDQIIVKWNIRRMRLQRMRPWTLRTRDARLYLQTALDMSPM